MLALTHPGSNVVNGLRKGQLLALRGRRGDRIESRRGALWVTQDGDPTDVVLDAGEAHVLEHDARVLIQALDPACVSVQPRLLSRATWWQRLRDVAGLVPHTAR